MTNQNPSVYHIIQFRKKRDTANLRNPANVAGRITIILSCILSLIIALTAILSTIIFSSLMSDLPSTRELTRLLDPPGGTLLEPTVIYDRTGAHILMKLENPAASNKRYLPIDENQENHIPKVLIDATIAVADPHFWSDSGFSFAGLTSDDHSSIAQHLVVDLLLWDEPVGWNRTLRERILAAQILEKYSREEILEWYLNSANYGRLAYGADAASWTYFGKSATDLTLSEAAILAATAQTPGLNPHDSPDLVVELKNEALHSMLLQGYITIDEYKKANEERTQISEPRQPDTELAPAYTDLVFEQLSNQFDLERIKRGGLQVISTLDFELQMQALCASETQIARISPSLESGGNSTNDVDCEAARLLPSTTIGNQSLTEQELVANMIVLDPLKGEIMAMVGDLNPGSDPAHLPGHTPGTILSPFIYLTAFTRGYNPASLLWDIPSSLPAEMEGIENPDQKFHGPVRLRTSLANDYVIPTVQMLLQIGPENVSRLLKQFGIDFSEIEVNQSANTKNLLEDRQVTLLDATQAYGILANNGLATGQILDASSTTNGLATIEPLSILKVSDSLGQIWMQCQDPTINCQVQTKPVISTQLAYLMTHILSDETARWPSLGHPNPLEIGRPVSVKIGQTTQKTDTWTIGYTPRMVIGVWIGSNKIDLQQELPISAAAGLWHAIIQYQTRETPVTEWTIPPGISSIDVCDPSGMLPSMNCPVVVSEVFQDGREPTQEDTLFRSFQINRETGRLATVFTPPELIETRVYMQVPPEASDWASQAGLPTPPESYDALDQFKNPLESVKISSPEMFSNISGRVVITGNADIERFQYYRLQVGEGLNPASWLQISDDITTPISDGELANWDTTGLQGLYALQLLVVDQDNNVKTYTTQVTIDNRPPEVSIRYPENGQDFTYPKDSMITLEADASDDLELVTVIFYLDETLIASLNSPPYVVPWEVRIGEHSLRVRAVDLAGNYSEEQIEFKVTR